MVIQNEISFNLKFLEASSATERSSVIDQLKELGATSVKRLFPRDKDPKFASFYVVTAPPRAAEEAIQIVRSHPAVDFIEEQPKRWLADPERGLSA